MRFYHFCPAHMLESILKDGITKGKLPIIIGGKVQTADCCQWLTEEPDPEKQSWATSHMLPYSRTAYRLSIWIPKRGMKHLMRAEELLPNLPSESKRLITDWEGSEKWFVYLGVIPPKWIETWRSI
jgi:hypothetical protein